jgi:hypothetical protein
VVIIRDTGVFALKSEPNSVEVSNCAASTFYSNNIVSAVAFFDERYVLSKALYLEHGEQQMLFSALVLITVQGKHDGLKQSIDLRQADQSTQRRNMSWFTLQQEEQVSVLLHFSVVRIITVVIVILFFQMRNHLVLLENG